MSIYYITDEGDEPAFLCSNRGYGDFGRWADGLSAKKYPAVVHLWEYGWYGPASELAEQLKAAAGKFPPDAEGLAEVVAELARVAEAIGDDPILITNGMTSSD